MTDGSRSGPNTLHVPAHHGVIAFQCVKCLNSYLHQNLCNIERGDSKSMVIEEAVDNLIPAYLKYAAIYWGTHLSLIAGGTAHPALISELHTLTTTHILHWLECLSLIGKLHLAVDSLRKTALFILVRGMSEFDTPLLTFTQHQDCAEIRDLLDEVRRMLPQIFKFASVYPLEVYYSALEWLPSGSGIRSIYHSTKLACVPVGLRQQWDSCEQSLRQPDGCNAVAFFPDGVHIASGLN